MLAIDATSRASKWVIQSHISRVSIFQSNSYISLLERLMIFLRSFFGAAMNGYDHCCKA
jgi:hypothetical protein